MVVVSGGSDKENTDSASNEPLMTQIQELLKINERQALRIKSLAKENGELRSANTRLKAGE